MSERVGVPCLKSGEANSGHPEGTPNPADSSIDSLAFCKFVINSVPIGIISMDSDFRITEFNHWAGKVTGYTPEQAIGHRCCDILQSEMCEGSCPLKTVLNQAKATVSGRTTIRNREGMRVPVQFDAAALFGAEGRLIGGVEAFMDITKLIALERERADFIAMLAHDMRSSLTGIHGLGLRLLRKLDNLDKGQERQYIEIITREAAKLESLIDDFLDYSRIEAGRLKLNLRATSLDKELEEIFDTYKLKAAQRGIVLDLQIEDILPVVEADTNRLRRVFTNLLDNAVKFSREEGVVTITAQEKDREVVVMITDEGIGIDPEDLPHIFDVFHRGKTTGGVEGHGLGLATVKAIVEGHGGRIVVTSQPNKGSTFTIFLPKREEGPPRFDS